MIDIAKEVSKYIVPVRQRRHLEFEYAGESCGCDPSISEVTVPHLVLYVPRGFIKKYNLSTRGKASDTLPDADIFWKFLHPHLVGKGWLPMMDIAKDQDLLIVL
ncbi:MAG: hypothetical protein HY513_02905 [Candidatus Aenigmarchaeota archaeon]|nr:hypothetical protein [Candidatus Aenigmarchaeota archaeon]